MAVSAVPDDRTLHMVHVFDASPGRVFAAWTEPERFAEWFGPPGLKCLHCRFDLQVGGTWELVGERAGGRHTVSGKYLEIDPPRRLSFTWAWHQSGDLAAPREHETMITLQFNAVGARTELTLTQRRFRDATGASNHREGWAGSFTKLEALLARSA
ncbi:MAG: SRPBCC domain-containing protein [Alphaproteobacteria bacterium]|nr:SRPBCC domain-containing protein [Alphaproteobacteria bacterium]